MVRLCMPIKLKQKNIEAKDSVLYIFSDRPKSNKGVTDIPTVRNCLVKINWFTDVNIGQVKTNIGLAESII